MLRTKTGYDEYVGRSKYVAGVIIVWIAPKAGKTSQILCCDWLPAVSHKNNFPHRNLLNSLLTNIVRSRWLKMGLIFFLLVYGP